MSWVRQRLCATAAAALIMLIARPGARAQGQWVKLAPFPDPCPELLGAAANGKVYVFGGLLGNNVKGLVYEYDPAENQWSKKKKMPLSAHHVMVASYRDKIYIFGGGGVLVPGGPNWVPLDTAWEYDPAADSWKIARAHADRARRGRGGSSRYEDLC